MRAPLLFFLSPYVHVHICVHVWMYGSVYACRYKFFDVSLFECTCVCMFVWAVCMHACMHACMHVCTCMHLISRLQMDTDSYVTWRNKMWHAPCIVCRSPPLPSRDIPPSYATHFINTGHASFIRAIPQWCVTRLNPMWRAVFICNMTHSYGTRLIHVIHDSFIWDTTPSYRTRLNPMWHDVFTCDMTYSWVTRPIHTCHDSFTDDITIHMWNAHSYAIRLIHMCHVTIWHTICETPYTPRLPSKSLGAADMLPSFVTSLFTCATLIHM